jgi:hypothetical protein
MYLPGTSEKIAVMAQRASNGEELFHPGDAGMDEFDLLRVQVYRGDNKTPDGWRVVTEKDYRNEGNHEPYWDSLWLGDPLGQWDDLDRAAEGRRIIIAMKRGRWLTMRDIRLATKIKKHYAMQFWFHRFKNAGLGLEKRYLKKVGLYEYRLDPSCVDAALSVVDNYR